MSQGRQSSEPNDESRSFEDAKENQVREANRENRGLDASEKNRGLDAGIGDNQGFGAGRENRSSGVGSENLSFEAGIERLEQIVKALEERDVSLENALSLFKEGVGLVKHCNALLDKAEQVMGVLVEEDGEMRFTEMLQVEGLK